MFITSTQNCSAKYTCTEDRQREKQMGKMQKTKHHQPSNWHTQGDSTFVRELRSSSCNIWLPSIMALNRDKRNNPQARLCPWLIWNSHTLYKQSRLNPEKSPSVFASLPQQREQFILLLKPESSSNPSESISQLFLKSIHFFSSLFPLLVWVVITQRILTVIPKASLHACFLW